MLLTPFSQVGCVSPILSLLVPFIWNLSLPHKPYSTEMCGHFLLYLCTITVMETSPDVPAWDLSHPS